MGQIRKVHEIVLADMAPEGVTTQESVRVEFEDTPTPEGGITPPFSMDQLACLSTESATRGPIIEAIARNTVGLGYAIQVDAGHDNEVEDPVKACAGVEAHLEALAKRDRRLKNPSLTELLVAVKTDEEEVGNGYIEVSRKRGVGTIDGLFHIPGKRVRRKADRTGYLMVPVDGSLADTVEFYDFGTKVEYDKTGAPKGTLAGSGKRWATNELIAFSLYSSISRDYGMPRDIGLMLEYLADKLAAQANISFFDAGGTPPSVIFVSAKESREGDEVTFEVPPETPQRIAATLKGSKGTARVAIIPLPAGTQVQAEQLGQMSERDMGNVAYRADIRTRQLGAFRVSPIFLGLAGEGRYDAEVQRAITLEQVFDPEQARYQTRLGDTLLRELGYLWAAMKFNRLAVESDAAKRDSVNKGAEVGTVTRREWRKANGMPPLPEAKPGSEPGPGQVPAGWNDTVIDAMGLPAGAENRTTAGVDQRGLRPGIGAREQLSSDAELAKQLALFKEHGDGPDHVEGAVTSLAQELGDLTDVHVGNALRRTRALGAEIARNLAADEDVPVAPASGS